MKDAPLEVCPKDKCRQKTWGKGKVKRQLGTGAGLLFKGSGFYITDYRSESYQNAAKKESDTPKPAEKKSEPSVKPTDKKTKNTNTPST